MKSHEKEQLLDRIWDMDYAGGTRTVDTHIKTLRLKLAKESKEASEYIQTVWGVGYRFEKKQSMIEVGEKLQSLYKGGKVTDELVDKIEEYNLFSNFNVFAVRNPRELSACVPFEIDYDTLIGPDERQQLLQ
ncbi:hypothetical protein RhiirA1_484749, partial [Rhizophagus irregularis]